MQSLKAALLLALLAWPASGPLPASAQTAEPRVLDPGRFELLRWRNVGPARAGRSIAAAGSTARPLEYYAGFAGGGLWRTVDGGTSWRPVTDGWIRSSSVGAVAVAESDPDIVYIGTGEVQIQRNSLQGDGVYGSRDGGETWAHLGLEDSQVVSRIRVDPRDPDIVFAAVLGHPFGPSAQRGVYRSRDGGRSWERVLYRDDRTGAVDLVIDRTNPDVVYAALWRARVRPGGSVTGGPGSGLFKSADGGDSWTELSSAPGFPTGELGKIGITVAGDGNRVYALVDAEDGGVFRSDDGGRTWILVNDDGPLRQRPPYFNRIVADPNDADVVYVLNLQLYRSDDGGTTYEIVRAPHVDHHDLWIAPGDARRMISSNDGGPTVSVTGGESWTRQDMPTAQLYNVGVTRDVPYHVCGPQQDEAAICVPSTQTRWRSASPYVGSGGLDGPWYAPGGGEFGTMAPHPTDPNLFYATGPNVITLYDRRTGLVQARDVQPMPLSARGAGAERFTPFAPIVFSAVDPDVLYAGSQHVWKLRLSTLEWERMSPDLTRGAGTPDASGAVLSIEPSPHDEATVWVGSDDGLVHVTRDAGVSWSDVTPAGLPRGAKVTSITVSPHEPHRVYVAATGYEIDDRTPYLFRTADAGMSWTSVVEGLGPDEFVRVVHEDAQRPGLLFAGTEHGVFVSFDDGNRWESLSLNLPDVSVSDLVVEGGDLVIATQGRSFWILEGVGVLRELSPTSLASPVHVFSPGPVVRRLTPAVFDYLLSREAATVRIEILDAEGALVRSYDGGEPPGRAGHNRFVWDLRYAPATVFEGMIFWVGTPEGPLAPPGRYRVRVSADGVTRSRDFEVVRDPAAAVTDEDLRAQFELALAARDGITAANEGVIEIRALRLELEDRIGRVDDESVRSSAEALIAALSEVEDQLYQVRLRSQLDAIVHPVRLNNRLANLKLSIETGDGRPTPPHYAAYEQLSGELEAQLERLDELVDGLDALNERLTAAGLEPVELRRER